MFIFSFFSFLLFVVFVLCQDVYTIGSQSWSQLPNQNGMTQRSDFACWPLASKIYCTGGYNFFYNVSYKSTIVLDLNSAAKVFQGGVAADRAVESGDCRALVLDGKVRTLRLSCRDYCTIQSIDIETICYSIRVCMIMD
jgi:hypothetical protein